MRDGGPPVVPPPLPPSVALFLRALGGSASVPTAQSRKETLGLRRRPNPARTEPGPPKIIDQHPKPHPIRMHSQSFRREVARDGGAEISIITRHRRCHIWQPRAQLC